MQFLFQAAGVALLMILAVGLALVFRMKNRAEKIMVTQFLGTVSVGWLLLAGKVYGKFHLFDVALVFSLLAVLTTVAFVDQRINEAEEGDDESA